MGEIKNYLKLRPKTFGILVGLALILVFLVALYQINSGVSEDVTSVIRSDLEEEILVDNFSDIGEIVSAQKERRLPRDSVLELQLKEGSGITKRDIHIKEVLEKISPEIPDELIDSLGESFIFAIYTHENAEMKNPFILIEVKDFQKAFSGMRAWESKLAEDLPKIFGDNFTPLAGQSFQTETIRNQSVKVLLGVGETNYLYSFPNNETLFIGSNTQTFEKVLDILLVSKLR